MHVTWLIAATSSQRTAAFAPGRAAGSRYPIIGRLCPVATSRPSTARVNPPSTSGRCRRTSEPLWSVTDFASATGTVGFGQAGAAISIRGANRIDSIRQTPRVPGGSIRSRVPGPSGGRNTVSSCQAPRLTAARAERSSLVPSSGPK